MAVSLFGYLTGRILGKKALRILEEEYKRAGCFDNLSREKARLCAMISSGRNLQVIDEEAVIVLSSTYNCTDCHLFDGS